MAEYQEVLCEAYRVLRRGGLLLVHEVAGELVCGWEGKTVLEIAPNIHKVSARAMVPNTDSTVDQFNGLCHVTPRHRVSWTHQLIVNLQHVRI